MLKKQVNRMAQTFVYKVRDRMGKAHTGQIEADTRDAVVDTLRQKGYVVTRIEERTTTPTVSQAIAKMAAVNARDLSVLCRQFSTMVGAGLPLMKCLSVLIDQTYKVRLREAVEEVSREVESGSALSAALSKHDRVFPPIMVAMVRAGETGGILDETLARLAEHFEDEYELREKIKTATRYPLIVCAIAAVVVVIMMTFVLPTFEKMLTTMGVELPLPTKILMAGSMFMKKYVLFLLGLMTLGVVWGVRYVRSFEGKRRYDRFVLKIPLIRSSVLKISTARLCRTLGTLLQSGVPIMQAIEVSEATTGNSVIVEGLAKAKDSIREGGGIAGPLEATGLFNQMVVQMIAVGEETGTLDTMLKKVADFYEKEVKTSVENLSALLEPSLVVFLGLVVGGMIISILLPLLRIYESVGK